LNGSDGIKPFAIQSHWDEFGHFVTRKVVHVPMDKIAMPIFYNENTPLNGGISW
jgi:hypothetical protein